MLATGYARPPTGALAYPVLNKPYTFADLSRKLGELMKSENAMRILVVEDESLIRLDVVDALRERGFEVEEAASASAAKRTLDAVKGEIGALIVDLGLPDQKGDDLAAEIRVKHPQLPIVIASGYSGQAVQTRFRADPFVAFVEKPYNVGQLEDAISRLRGK